MKYNYPLIKVPSGIVQDNSKMNLQDVKNYFDWFISIKNERLQILFKEVFSSDKVEYSIDKLQALNYFFNHNIHIEKRSDEEVRIEQDKIPNHLTSVHKVSDYKFVEPTYSIIIDLSIYFGEMLMNEVKGLKWMYEQDEKLVDYGYPIIVKEKTSFRLCPLWIIEILTRQIFLKKSHEDRMIELYNTWKNTFEGKGIDFLDMVEGWSKGK